MKDYFNYEFMTVENMERAIINTVHDIILEQNQPVSFCFNIQKDSDCESFLSENVIIMKGLQNAIPAIKAMFGYDMTIKTESTSTDGFFVSTAFNLEFTLT